MRRTALTLFRYSTDNDCRIWVCQMALDDPRLLLQIAQKTMPVIHAQALRENAQRDQTAGAR